MCNKAILDSRNIKLTTFETFVCWFWSWSLRHIFNHPKDLLFWNWTKKCQHQSTCFGVIVSRENPTNLLWNTRSQSTNLIAIQQNKSWKGSPQWTAWHTLACYQETWYSSCDSNTSWSPRNQQANDIWSRVYVILVNWTKSLPGWKVVRLKFIYIFNHLWTVYVWFHFIGSGWGRLLVHLEHIWTIPATKTVEFVNASRLEYCFENTCNMWNHVKLVLLPATKRAWVIHVEDLPANYFKSQGCRLKKIFQLPNSNKKSCAGFSPLKKKNILTHPKTNKAPENQWLETGWKMAFPLVPFWGTC